MSADHLCLTCALAVWHKTANGRLHPDGQGRCAWTQPHIPTPAAWHWGRGFGQDRRKPLPSDGNIERKPRAAVTECETYERISQ